MIRNTIARLTMGKLMLLLSVVSLLFALALMLLLSEVMRDRVVHQLARDEAKNVSGMAFQSLYSVMRKRLEQAGYQ